MMNRLLIQCSRIKLSPPQRSFVEKMLDSEIHWKQVLQRSAKEGITPFLYRHLKSFQDRIPNSVLEQLKKIYVRNTGRNIFLFKKIAPLLRSFKRENMRVCLSRGGRLALTLYPEWGLRHFADIDFMVYPGEALHLVDILDREGYWKGSYASSFPTKKKKKLMWMLETGFKNDNLWLDFHFNYPGIEIPLDLDERIWEEVQSFSLFDTEVSIFPAEYELCLLCLHAQKHCYGRLMWLTDIAELSLSPGISWEKVFDICKRLEISPSVYYGLHLANVLWPETVAMSLLKELEPGKITKGLLAAIWPEEKVALRRPNAEVPGRISSLLLLASWRNILLKLKTLFWITFPPRAYMAYLHKVPLNSLRIYWLYLGRMFRPAAFFAKLILKKI